MTGCWVATGGADDLLDLGSGGGVSGGGSLINGDTDLLGAGSAPSYGSAPSASGKAPIKIAEESRGRVLAAFKNLLTSEQGLLFENDVVQVGIRQQYRGSQVSRREGGTGVAA